ncbi:MAG: sugar ABC transporter permease [Dehalococcoidales bacterium]|nr:sugar ABC transporter permease [Dehalococcoidales bacterium]
MSTTERSPSPAWSPGGETANPGLFDRFLSFFDRHAPLLFPAPAVLALVVVMIFPSIFNIYMSLHEWFATSMNEPKFIGLQNFTDLFLKDQNFVDSIWRTVYFTAIAVVVEMVLGLAIALLLNRELKGHKIIRTLFMLPMMATPTAMALIWVLMYNPTLGVLNYLLSLLGVPPQEWLSNLNYVIPALAIVDIWQYTPFVTLVLLAGLATVPVEPVESARIDGASAWQVLWHIILPLLRPTMMVAALFRIIDTLKTFDTIYVMTQGGPGRASQTMNLFAFQTAFEYFHVGYAAAVSISLIVLVFIVSGALIRLRRQAE